MASEASLSTLEQSPEKIQVVLPPVKRTRMINILLGMHKIGEVAANTLIVLGTRFGALLEQNEDWFWLRIPSGVHEEAAHAVLDWMHSSAIKLSIDPTMALPPIQPCAIGDENRSSAWTTTTTTATATTDEADFFSCMHLLNAMYALSLPADSPAMTLVRETVQRYIAMAPLTARELRMIFAVDHTLVPDALASLQDFYKVGLACGFIGVPDMGLIRQVCDTHGTKLVLPEEIERKKLMQKERKKLWRARKASARQITIASLGEAEA